MWPGHRQFYFVKTKIPPKKTITEYSAGGIIYRVTPAGQEIAFILDSYKKWTFPKGRIKKGENVGRAALREAKEEVGLSNLKIIQQLGKIDIWFTDRFERKNALIHKYIYYVLLQAQAGARLTKPPKPKQGEIIRAVRWVPLSEAMQLSNYKDVRAVLKKAIDIIQKYQTRLSKSSKFSR